MGLPILVWEDQKQSRLADNFSVPRSNSTADFPTSFCELQGVMETASPPIHTPSIFLPCHPSSIQMPHRVCFH